MSPLSAETALRQVENLPFWQGKARAQALGGGITNRNFTVSDSRGTYVVRLGEDIPEHGIMRFNELAASKAAHAAGISPAVRYHAPGVLVMDFIEGRTLSADDIRTAPLPALDLLAKAHRDMQQHFHGALLSFWPFQVNQDYIRTLRQLGSQRGTEITALESRLTDLRRSVGQIDMVYCHNDLLAANFIDDGRRLWLIDWDYGGYNSPLFDLANFSTNSGLDAAGEAAILERYFDAKPDAVLMNKFNAMRCMSLMRETLWSMVSEIRSTIHFDYVAYTDDYLARFEAAFARFKEQM